MANFAYVARSQAGEETTGFVAGNSQDDVVNTLHRQGMVVLHIVESRARGGSGRGGLTAFLLRGTVGARDLALFSSQFSTVIEAGIPMVRGLRGLAADMQNRTLSRALFDVSRRVETGEGLGDAMARHPHAFNKMYVNMVRAGERAGTLDQIIEQLATYFDRLDTIHSKLRSAMMYPAFVLGFVLLAGLFLLLEVVPTFSKIYADMGQDLPALTRKVIAASAFVRDNAPLMALVVVALVVGVSVLLRTRAGRLAADTMVLSMPIFGPLVRKSVMSRFSRTFGILLRSGLPVLESLDLVAGAVGNTVISRAVQQARLAVANGAGITESLRRTGRFPEMVLQLAATGEESGHLDAMFIKTSDFYDRQVESAAAGLAALVEPLMVVLVGGMIGFIVVSMFLPIFHLGDAVMRGGANL